MAEINKEQAGVELAKQLFYLDEMMHGYELDLFVDLVQRSIRRLAVVEGLSRKDRWTILKRETLEALAYKEPKSNLPGRGRLFSHFYAGIKYVCTTARLSENAHREVVLLIWSAIQKVEVEYKGHRVSVREVQRTS